MHREHPNVAPVKPVKLLLVTDVYEADASLN